MRRIPIVLEDLEKIASAPLPWGNLKDKVVLVSGANGFLPAYMVETLLYLNETRNLNISVVALVRNLEKAKARFTNYLDCDELQIVVGDVNELELNSLPLANVIIHAASQASPKYYGRDPVGTLLANTIGTANLLTHAKNSGSENFLYFSSGEVYGEVSAEHVPTDESKYGYINPLDVRSCYAESKRMGENMCVSWGHQYGLVTKIVRPFHTYGPGMTLDDGRVYADFIRAILSNQDISLNSDGSARRAFCYLSDAIEGFFTVLFKGEIAQAYNVGNPEQEWSIFDLAHELVGSFPEKTISVVLSQGVAAGYIKSTISRNSPKIDAARSLGWQPRTGVREGFLRTVRFFEQEDIAAQSKTNRFHD